jgi:glutamyl-tRNA synthetase
MGHAHAKPSRLDPVPPVVRFKNPRSGEVVVDDVVHGRVVFQNSELDDTIIARPHGIPTYNLASTTTWT